MALAHDGSLAAMQADAELREAEGRPPLALEERLEAARERDEPGRRPPARGLLPDEMLRAFRRMGG